MIRRPLSLATRLIVLMALVLMVGAAGLVALAGAYARLAADEAYDRLLAGAAFQIAGSIEIVDGVAGVDPPVSAFETLALAQDDRVFYAVIGPDGALLTGEEALARLIGPGPGGALETATLVHRGVAVRAVAIGRALSDAQIQGQAQVVVAQTTLARERLAQDLTGKAVVIVAALSALALASMALAVRFALSPLQRLEAVLRERGPTALHPITLATPKEITPLVGALNQFTGRLAEHLSATHRFIADAAHQLRTPIAALAGQVDLLAHDGDEGRRRHHLQRIEERTAQLSRLTTQLLNHAMVIHRAGTATLDRLDITDLAGRVLASAIPLSDDRDIEIAFHPPAQPALVAGDAVSLGEALGNLIHNALKHGVERRLSVAVLVDPASVTIQVIDDGPGIPVDQFEALLEPFRSRGGGFGLGLAIANEVAESHGGSLSVAQVESGFAVQLRLPHAPTRGQEAVP
ncbi:MAG: sensor histidine kinase [Alphaproteobacteria bacterium]|nr:sensor histidine kinase [Alphaproteobacteria bacterium]